MLRPETSSFGRSVLADAKAHPGQSGFRLLPNSGEAFRARAELIRNAQTSLDLQYYIVQDGLSTRLLIEELLKAADRGVRASLGRQPPNCTRLPLHHHLLTIASPLTPSQLHVELRCVSGCYTLEATLPSTS